MKKFTILFFLGLISSLQLFSQNSYIPNIVPKAPDAAALMKFSDIPVSPYTGSSSVTVPIYTIRVKGMAIPVSVDYHTGGIRLEEEASSVGLGWALNAGGMISRTINDQDDLGGGYFGTSMPQPEGNLTAYQPANGPPQNSGIGIIDSLIFYQCPTCSAFYNCPYCPVNGNRYIFEYQCSYLGNFTSGTFDYSNNFAPVADHTVYDNEPDTYSYNFMGNSGKFIIRRLGNIIVMEKQDNLKIQFVAHDSNVANNTFIITDDQGNKFYFEDTQTSHPAWMSSATPTSWYLSRVITQQKDTVNFSYAATGFSSVASETTQSYTAFGTYTGLQTFTNTGTTFSNAILQQIDYPDGRLQFYSDNSRADLSGGYKIDSVQIYAKTTAGLKYLKSDKLYYSYFKPGTITNAFEQERLKLDSVKEFSGGNSLKPYSFQYNAYPAAFPEKHSFSIDHWGYYNGAGNTTTTTLIPSTTAYYVGSLSAPPTQFTYNGANREPSFPGSQAFSLRKVTYPTGGSSIFTYEANTYDYNKSASRQLEYPQQVFDTKDTIIHIQQSNFVSGNASGVIDFSQIYPVIPPGTAGYNVTITVTFVSNYTLGWPHADRTTFGKLNFNFNNGTLTDLGDSNLTCSGPQCSTSYQYTISQASATAYTWVAHWDSSIIPAADFSEIHIEANFKALETVAHSNPTLTAGGLRIASIVDSTATGGIVKKRSWNYHYGSSNQYSNGVLMSFPSYVRTELQPTGATGGQAPVLVLFSSSYTPATSAIGGNIVGYSHVTETTVDPSTAADDGKIVYSFINTADSVISYQNIRYPGIPNMGNNLNGSEISRVTYRNNSGSYWKLGETDNFYHTTNRKVYYSAKYRSCQLANTLGNCLYGTTPVENQGIAEFFPSIKSERVLLDSTRNFVYDPADTTKFLLTSTKNFYDDTAHYLVTRTKMVDSKGNTHVTKITYPQDYRISYNHTGNAILDSLIAHNMVAETIEKRDSLYYPSVAGNVISATENRYKQLASKVMVQDKVYRLDITKPVNDFVPVSISGATYNQDSRYRQLISFDTYDSKNNIAQYTLTNELPVSIIWDYRQMSPIAQVKNGAQADIAYTSFEAEGTGNWTVASATRDSTTAAITGYKSYNLASGGISKSGLTSATTYVVSYWTKNASPLTITGTITGYPLKGATIKGWTYYEHKVTGVLSVSLTGTGNIDEVRLYPQNAQMTSYTYSPQVGVTTISDARGGISYYEYDGFQRLMNIKDQNGNIIKSFDYHYANH